MRKIWDLPDEGWFKYTGPDWLLILLANISKDRRGLVLLVLWRAWHLRNDVLHEKGDSTIESSVHFLERYLKELNIDCKTPSKSKGKEPVLCRGNHYISCHDTDEIPLRSDVAEGWSAPAKNWVKINVDASFVEGLGDCSIGCIARSHDGNVIWARNQAGIKCQDPMEAEARACLLGLQCVHDRENYSIILESDNALVIDAIKKKNQGMSRLWHIFEEIDVIQASCHRFVAVKIGRESNQATHELAAVARRNGQNNFWLGCVPPAIDNIVAVESVIVTALYE